MPDQPAFHGRAQKRRHQKSRGNRQRQRPGRQGGAAQGFLHQKGCIGAKHDKFAMRHIDHAHDTKSHRQTKCCEQQNRPKRQPLEKQFASAAKGQLPINPRDCRINRLGQRCIASACFQQHSACGLKPRSAEAFNTGALQRLIIGSKPRRALCQHQPFANARHGFTRKRCIQKRQILRAAAAQNPIRGA